MGIDLSTIRAGDEVMVKGTIEYLARNEGEHFGLRLYGSQPVFVPVDAIASARQVFKKGDRVRINSDPVSREVIAVSDSGEWLVLQSAFSDRPEVAAAADANRLRPEEAPDAAPVD